MLGRNEDDHLRYLSDLGRHSERDMTRKKPTAAASRHICHICHIYFRD